MNDDLRAAPEGGAEKKMKVVYTIIDRGPDKKGFWVRLGTAFENRDHSLNVRLDACPTNGTLHIRDWEPREDRPAAGSEARAAGTTGYRRSAGSLL